jgi:mono/diheme cytochrome c family protein
VNGDKRKLIDVVLNGLNIPITVKGNPYNNLMPAHNFLRDDDIAQVLNYIRQNFTNHGTPISAMDVKKARKK